MSIGGKGSSTQWQKGEATRGIKQQLQMPFDMVTRGILGQMAEPPETPISPALQQAISNLQGGNPAAAFGLGGGMAERLASRGVGASGTGGAGYAPGSLSVNAEGGQQGLQSREQLGLPSRESYFPYMPTGADIESLGFSPVRSGIKKKTQLLDKVERLQGRIADRVAEGRPTTMAEKKLANTQKVFRQRTGEMYRRP